MTDDRNRDDALSGAYALDALPDDEREAFEATFSSSESVRHEVTELADTAVLLGLAAEPVAPSAALKASILNRIQSLPQLPAHDAAAQDSAAGAHDGDADQADAAAPVRPLAPITPLTPLPDETMPDETIVTQEPGARPLTAAERTAQSRWFSKPVIALASAAAVIGIIAGGGVIANTITESNTQQVMADRLAEINAARDTQRAAAEVEGGGTATLVWSNELLASAIVVDGLDPLPSGKVYELWYIGDSGPRAAGTFTVGDDGSTWRVLDGDMKAGDAVGVTVEPSGGSPKPTTDPIVALQSA
jgi:anti-sigma-K factor RskA